MTRDVWKNAGVAIEDGDAPSINDRGSSMSILRYVPAALLTATLMFAGTASAQTWYDVRQANQRERMQDYRTEGELTRGEYRNLQNGMQRIERYENFAERDGRVSSRERATLDRMLDRQGRQIYRQAHDRQQAGDHNGWGGRDGRGNNGWNHSRNHGGDRNGWDNGRHNGWSQGNHNGWQGQRPPGFERREAHQEQRIHNGVRDGSLTRGEAARLQHGQNRVDHQQARARADGVVTQGERSRINGMQNHQSRQIHDARTNARTQPSQTMGNGGWRMQQASAAPTQPRPTFTRASSPTSERNRSR
jgi:hypothetical protein